MQKYLLKLWFALLINRGNLFSADHYIQSNLKNQKMRIDYPTLENAIRIINVPLFKHLIESGAIITPETLKFLDLKIELYKRFKMWAGYNQLNQMKYLCNF